MTLSIAETLIRDRDRQQRSVRARREGKTLNQVLDEERRDRLARTLAGVLVHELTAEIEEAAHDALAASKSAAPDRPPAGAGDQGLAAEIQALRACLGEILEQLAFLRARPGGGAANRPRPESIDTLVKTR
jgi:hypothetical protein